MRQHLYQYLTSAEQPKFVFEIPIIKKMDKTDVLYIDNLVIDTPLQKNDVDLQVMNLDGYNKSAKAQEIVQGLKIQPKSNGLSSTSSSEAESSKGIGVVGIVVIVVRCGGYCRCCYFRYQEKEIAVLLIF